MAMQGQMHIPQIQQQNLFTNNSQIQAQQQQQLSPAQLQMQRYNLAIQVCTLLPKDDLL